MDLEFFQLHGCRVVFKLVMSKKSRMRDKVKVLSMIDVMIKVEEWIS